LIYKPLYKDVFQHTFSRVPNQNKNLE